MNFGNMINKIINFVYILTIVTCIGFVGWTVFSTGKEVYKDLAIQQKQMNELYHNQAILLDYMSEENLKPTPGYLASVTTLMMGKKGEQKWIGTGVVVAKKDGYYFILTNKHVCNKTTEVCGMMNFYHQDSVILLEYVGEPESITDLALWRTNELPNEQPVIKGMSKTGVQDKVYSIGHYLGILYTYTEGVNSGVTQEDTTYNLFNMPCAFGCSGSGIFDKYGNLVGLVSAVPSYELPGIGLPAVDTNKVLGIPPEVIALFLKKYLG